MKPYIIPEHNLLVTPARVRYLEGPDGTRLRRTLSPTHSAPGAFVVETPDGLDGTMLVIGDVEPVTRDGRQRWRANPVGAEPPATIFATRRLAILSLVARADGAPPDALLTEAK